LNFGKKLIWTKSYPNFGAGWVPKSVSRIPRQQYKSTPENGFQPHRVGGVMLSEIHQNAS
jgi:hypothetical protein